MDRLLNYVSITLGSMLLLGVFFNFLNVIMRYGFGNSFSWSEEVLVYGLIFIVMIGSIIVTARNEHLKIDFIISILNSNSRSLLIIFSQIITCIVFIYLSMQSQKIVFLMFNLNQTSVAARIPMWIPHSSLLIAFSLAALAALWSAAREVMSLRGGTSGESVDGSASEGER